MYVCPWRCLCARVCVRVHTCVYDCVYLRVCYELNVCSHSGLLGRVRVQESLCGCLVVCMCVVLLYVCLCNCACAHVSVCRCVILYVWSVCETLRLLNQLCVYINLKVYNANRYSIIEYGTVKYCNMRGDVIVRFISDS